MFVQRGDKFLVRTLVRNLRIGAMMRTLLPALAQAVIMNSSDEQVTQDLKYHIQCISSSIVEVYNILPNFDLLIPSLMEKELNFRHQPYQWFQGYQSNRCLQSISSASCIKLLINLVTNQCIILFSQILDLHFYDRITNGALHVLKLFQDKAFTCKYKYDGQRAHIHKLADGSVRVFSRNGDETTLRFPDLVGNSKRFMCLCSCHIYIGHGGGCY